MQSPSGEPPDHGTGVDDDDPVPTSSTRHIERWARERYPRTIWLLSEPPPGRRRASANLIGPTIAQYDRLARQYPEVADRLTSFTVRPLQTGPVGGSTELAESTNDAGGRVRTITLNLNVFDQRKALSDRLNLSERLGFHPSGTSQIESVVTHEFGHHVWFLLEDEGFHPGRFVSGFSGDRRSLSEYAEIGAGRGHNRDAETFAEAFVAHYLGDERARNHPLTRSVVQYIERSVRALRARQGPT